MLCLNSTPAETCQDKPRSNTGKLLFFTKSLWKINQLSRQNLYSTYAFKGVAWFAHSHGIQDVDEFVSLIKQIWSNILLHHLLTNRSSAVNGCRQNESPNS